MIVSGDVLISILTFVLGVIITLIFFLLTLTATRPKLIGIGGGTGTILVPGREITASHISIYNKPTYLGIKIPREAANIESARVYDLAAREFVGPSLRWRESGGTDLGLTTSIQAGKSSELYVFAKERNAEDYFIYTANSLNSEILQPLIKYKEPKKDFLVVLTDEIGRKYRFIVTVRNKDQSVKISFKITFQTRIQMVRQGLAMILRAFLPNR